MAFETKEIRIPIVAEIHATTTSQDIQNQIPSSLSSANQATGQSMGQAISATFLIQSGQKLIAATGNTQISKAIGDTVKYSTLTVRAFSGDPTAVATMALDFAVKAIKKVNELKQEAQINNQAQYNKILNGQIFLGSGEYITTKDFWGNITYSKK